MAGKNITVIPARKRVGSTAAKEKIKKLRVAAYCRVSTETEEQNLSYEVQVAHYTEFIKKNTEWEFAGIFADDGISGTNTKNLDSQKIITWSGAQHLRCYRIATASS